MFTRSASGLYDQGVCCRTDHRGGDSVSLNAESPESIRFGPGFGFEALVMSMIWTPARCDTITAYVFESIFAMSTVSGLMSAGYSIPFSTWDAADGLQDS